jgi:hypothetical protein
VLSGLMHIRAGAKGSAGFVIFKEKLFLETLLVERAALIPQVKLNLHLRRDPHNSNSELFLLGGFSRANHDFPSIVHSIEQHSHFRRPRSKQRGAFPD